MAGWVGRGVGVLILPKMEGGGAGEIHTTEKCRHQGRL